MSTVGQIEKNTQARVAKLFRDSLGYDYLGNWIEREGNSNIETRLLRGWLKKRGVEDTLITRALHLFSKIAGDTSKSPYDRNRAIHEMLRYGVKVKPDVGENTETVWLIDWQNPERNHFAIAEEVAVAAIDPKAFGKRPDIVLYVNGIALGMLELKRVTDARVLIITDRTELDEQIEKVFLGVNEQIYRTRSGADLIAKLNATTPWLLCSLIHKFGGKEDSEAPADIAGYIEEVKNALPPDFKPKGDLYVLVDECHRTQSGELHKAMKSILPNAIFIGFTGTPLLKADKQKSIEVFGRYIHTYKFDEAVRDKVVLDLRYEARDIDQNITSQKKIDQWFEAKTKGLTDLARAQLKQRWGTMQKVLSSQSRLEKIVADILMDMETRDRLRSGRGNAMLVSGSIYQACKFYELFARTHLAGKCAIITSYKPSPGDIKGEESGAGLTERLRQYDIYKKMLADWFNEPPEIAVNKIEAFEKAVKKKFIEEPGQMKLLIVVDKLLTGFDAPSA
jgi:type I site-specific restriction-modification system R (restriction) subunit